MLDDQKRFVRPQFNGGILKDYTHRHLVQHFLPYWTDYLKTNGSEQTLKVLKEGKTKLIGRKDRLGLIQALNLNVKED